MARTVRRRPISGLEPDPFEVDQEFQPVEKPKPADPARVAVALLLRRALSEIGAPLGDVARDGAVTIVHVPSDAWVEVAREHWQTWARDGEAYQDGIHERHWQGAPWTAWTGEEPGRAALSKSVADSFARAVSLGKHCAGFTVDPEWLGSDMVHSADYHLTVPTLTGDDIAAIAAELCGDVPGETLTDTEAAAVGPRHLRLVRRLDQSATAYVRKLRELLGREYSDSQAARPRTVREAPGLDRLHGMDEAVAWGLGVAVDLQAYAAGTLPWGEVGGHACLLSGPPGCGKTLYAAALAATCAVPLITGSYGKWLGSGSSHQGDLLKGMRTTFAEAKKKGPSVLFIDEIDAFPNRETIAHAWKDWEIQVVNTLLELVDGSGGREGVVLIAACNHPHLLDPALMRSGRLDKHIRVRLPDRPSMERILREHLGDDLPDMPLSAVALAVAGASGADAERIVRGARKRARDAGRALQLPDLMAEVDGGDDRSDADIRIAALHEAGHAVALCELLPGALESVTLRASGGSGGETLLSGGGTLLHAEDIHVQLICLLAGRAAEQVIGGSPSSGAGGGSGSDLARATMLAATAAGSFGLSDSVGLVWAPKPEAAELSAVLARDTLLKAQVRGMLDRAYADALDLVRMRRDAVDAVARALVGARALHGAAMAEIVDSHPAVPAERTP